MNPSPMKSDDEQRPFEVRAAIERLAREAAKALSTMPTRQVAGLILERGSREYR